MTRPVDFNNLDMIISVGYRVNSARGIQFRQWATQVLKAYLLKGYAVNARINQLEDKMDRRLALRFVREGRGAQDVRARAHDD